jgi:VIT1/CCC1 family predicted Fe2+/Mn2+ transporter
MNAFVWIVQLVLALLYVSGGAYKIFQFDDMASQLVALSRNNWRLVGLFEIVGGVLLFLPVVVRRMSAWASIAAAALALETLALAAVYARYSTEFSVSNPMVWALGMGIGAAVVAYGRRAPRARR